MVKQTEVIIKTKGKKLHHITGDILSSVGSDLPQKGLLNIFIMHTSASLIIQENADPTARRDLEEFLDRLVPEDESWYQHTMEGPDDSTSHIKSALTTVSVSIPIVNGRLGLGTWQGVYLWEHRNIPHSRSLLLTITGD